MIEICFVDSELPPICCERQIDDFSPLRGNRGMWGKIGDCEAMAGSFQTKMNRLVERHV